jgi:hypothetical protein
LKRETKANPSNPSKAWLMALIAWLIPGLGHVGQGRILRGALGGGAVLAVFLSGVALGGHIYGLRDTSEGLLSSLFGFCDLGSGLLCLGSRTMGLAVSEHPQLPTSEYGNVFLMVAGLLNFILALDAFDIGVGRKS